MITTYLQQAAAKLRYADASPSFIFSTQGMENYEQDKVPVWSVHVPILQDSFTFETANQKRSNLIVMFWAKAGTNREMNEDAAYYDEIFRGLVLQRDNWLRILDTVKDSEGRKVLNVLNSPAITTTYIAQVANFDAPGTAIQFNLPIEHIEYKSLCPVYL